MSIFATLNGVTVSSLMFSTSEDADHVGAGARRWDNRPSPARKAIKNSWSGVVSPAVQQDADALVALLLGTGHHFPFDHDLWSESGIGPEVTVNASIVNDGSLHPVAGVGVCDVSGTSQVWDARDLQDDKHTVMVFRGVGSGEHEHIIQRSDGARFSNGVRNDVLSFSANLVVSGGGVALVDDVFDLLVILPWVAPDDWCTAFYEWMSGRSMVFRASLDGYPDGETSVDAVSASGYDTEPGPYCGRSLQFGDNATDKVQYGTSDALAYSGQAAMTFEWWGLVDSTLASGAPGYALSHRTGADGYIIGHSGVSSGVFQLAVLNWQTGSGFPAVETNGAGISVDEWHHFVVVWSSDRGGFYLYVDGSLRSDVTETLTPGSLPTDDTGSAFVIGNDFAGSDSDPWCGQMREVRVHRQALTASQVLDNYQAGLFGRVAPHRRAFSALPNIELSGAIANWDRIECVGDVGGDQAVVSHGGVELGDLVEWYNNSRTIPWRLARHRARERSSIAPTPFYAISFDERYQVSGTIHRPSRGAFTATLAGANLWTPGPFGENRARDFNSLAANAVTLDIGVHEAIEGAFACAVGAWVYLASTGISRIVALEMGALAPRVHLSINASDKVEMTARSSGGDSNKTDATTASIATGRWHYVGGFVDLRGGTSGDGSVGAWLDDLEYSEDAAVTFGQERFSVEASVNNLIGSDGGGISIMRGRIAAVHFWRGHYPSAGEVRRIYQLGPVGVIR